jgi:hypothetical protein
MSQQYKTKQRTEKYGQWLKETLESLDHSEKTAKETIPKMYYELKEQGFDRLEARAIMKEDFGEKWSRWSLVKFLPEEAKDQGRRRGGLKSAEEREKKRLDQVRENNAVILKEKVIEQIVHLYEKGVRMMRIENEEVTAVY